MTIPNKPPDFPDRDPEIVNPQPAGGNIRANVGAHQAATHELLGSITEEMWQALAASDAENALRKRIAECTKEIDPSGTLREFVLDMIKFLEAAARKILENKGDLDQFLVKVKTWAPKISSERMIEIIIEIQDCANKVAEGDFEAEARIDQLNKEVGYVEAPRREKWLEDLLNPTESLSPKTVTPTTPSLS